MRLIFEDGTGSTRCYSIGLVYTATSADGSYWAPVTGSLSSHSAGIGNLAATIEVNGATPVAGFAGGHLFHVGVDPNRPASKLDGVITPTAGSAQSNPGWRLISSAAGPQGRVSVIWFDATKNLIYAVRTNPAATSFGVVRTIKVPAKTFDLNAIQAEGSSGRLDVVVNDTLSSTTGFATDFFQTQILPGLSLTAHPTKFSHKKGKKVTFTVTDAGQAVAGVKVSCLGRHATTVATGKVKLSFPKGAAKGKHVCTATKSGYNKGKTTIKVT
jgi:hypothetical protein